MPGKFFSPSPSLSPSPLLLPSSSPSPDFSRVYSSSSNLYSLPAASTNELSSLSPSQGQSLSPSPCFVNEESFLQEAEEIVATAGKSDRAVVSEKLTHCALRYTQWNTEAARVALDNIILCALHPLFMAIVAELLAKGPQLDPIFKAKLLVSAIGDYVYGHDLRSARRCIAQLVETNQYEFVCSKFRNSNFREYHPITCAVLYEAAASMLLNRLGHEEKLNQKPIGGYIYLAVLGKNSAYAQHFVDLYLKNLDISELLDGAQNTEWNKKYPRDCAVLFELIINKLLSNGPSSTERGVIKRHNDKLILYFKAAIHLYARAEDTQGLKGALSAYRLFDKSGRLFTILQNDKRSSPENKLISKVSKEILDSDNSDNSDDSDQSRSMRP